MKPLKTAALLLAPALLMGAFALYLGSTRPSRPFSVKVASAEAVPVETIDVFNGYDRRFEIVLRATGERPQWWGKIINGGSGTSGSDWTFFLEREGITTPFNPDDIQIWTTQWDQKRERYSNALLLHCGDVPTASALKVRGVTELKASRTMTHAPVPFEVTLKRAGQKWTKPVVSTDSGLAVQSITVKRNATNREATIKVSMPPGTPEGDWHNGGRFLDANWRWLQTAGMYGGVPFGPRTNINSIFYADIKASGDSRVKTYTFRWNEADMKRHPLRDVIASAHIAANGRWPLEIAFYAKQNGQQALGAVPALTRRG